jgi:multicomponent Na+:H+ antiporter subunit D
MLANLWDYEPFLIPQLLIIGLSKILMPYIFRFNENLSKFALYIANILFLFTTLGIAYHYLQGVRINYTLCAFHGFKIQFYYEALGVLFLILLSGLWPVALIYTHSYLEHNHMEGKDKFISYINITMLLACCVALSSNLLTMFIFYELVTLSTLPLVAFGGTEHAKRSVQKYFLILSGASITLMLPAILIIKHLAGTDSFIPGGILPDMEINHIRVLLLMFLFGCAKAALIPMHGWLPAAMVASYPVSALLHAVAVVKIGLFTLFKTLVYIFGLDYLHKNLGGDNLFILIPAATLLIASIFAIRQETLKKMLAYSTISQLGYAVLPAMIFTKEGIIAGVMQMFAHSFAKIVLFFTAGNIYVCTDRTKIKNFRGTAYLLPKSFACFSIASLSLIGIPPLSGFISKYYILSAASSGIINFIAIISIILGTILSANYLFRVMHSGYLPVRPGNYDEMLAREENGMLVACLICVSLVIIFPVLHKLIIDLAEFIY